MGKIKMRNPFFTIFTSVFNGEKHIHRVFESINKQVFKDFEWIIVNDGSVDNTSVLINSFIQDHSEIEIIFLEQNNSGKHIAWNSAVKLARGQLFVPVDADDSFMPDTLSFFHESWNTLTSEEQLALSGINVLCLDNNTENIVGTPFPVDGMITNNLELSYKFKIEGDKWGCIRLDLLKNIPFPNIKGPFFPENYLWLHLSKSYKVICFNKALLRYFTTDTGITQSVQSKFKQNPTQARVKLKYNIWFISNFGLYVLVHSPKEFFRSIVSTILQLILIIKR